MPAPVLEPLAPQVWLLRARPGEAGPDNRGQVSNLVVAEDGRRLWLIGAGPTPAFARALDCHLRQRFGRRATDVVVPWARAEQALGLAGYAQARRWAHAEVAATMARQCPACLASLRERLQGAAGDLGAPADDPVRVPSHRVAGASGRLGPWHWWALPRNDDAAAPQVVTVWRWRDGPLFIAPGLLGDGQPPDGRGADVRRLLDSTRRLAALGAAQPGARWVGEQGGVLAADAPQRHAAYWQALQAAVDAAFARGELPAAPPPLPGLDAAWLAHPLHALNWQRAWRQTEDRYLAEAPR